MGSVVSRGVQYRSDGRSVYRAKFVRKGHIDIRLNDTFSKTILSQKILLKFEELH